MPRSRHLPKFPLQSNIVRGATLGGATFVSFQRAELVVRPTAVPLIPSGGSFVAARLVVAIYFDALTDVRGTIGNPSFDWVEIPAASQRYYLVLSVDDIAKGFANEFRVAFGLQQAQAYPLV